MPSGYDQGRSPMRITRARTMLVVSHRRTPVRNAHHGNHSREVPSARPGQGPRGQGPRRRDRRHRPSARYQPMAGTGAVRRCAPVGPRQPAPGLPGAVDPDARRASGMDAGQLSRVADPPRQPTDASAGMSSSVEAESVRRLRRTDHNIAATMNPTPRTPVIHSGTGVLIETISTAASDP